MALFASILAPASAAGGVENVTSVASLAATTSSAEIALGPNVLFVVTASAAFFLRFGPAGLGAASASDFFIPSGAVIVFDTGNAFNSIRIFNGGASAINYSVLQLMRF